MPPGRPWFVTRVLCPRLAATSGDPLPPAAPASRRRPWWRRMVRWGLGLLVLVLGLVAVAPYLLRIDVVRQVVVDIAARDLNGQVRIGRAPLGWLDPIRLYQIEVTPPNEPPVLAVTSLEGDVPLWKLLWDSSELGEFSVTGPHAELLFGPQGPNFATLFAKMQADEAETDPGGDEEPDRAYAYRTVRVRINEGSFTWLGPQSEAPWDIKGINLQVALQRPAGQRDAPPELIVRSGRLVDNVAITQQMCQDALKYIAPSLAGATQAEGEFSLDLADWRLPLEAPEQGELGGTLLIHRVQVSPGPVMQLLATTVEALTMTTEGAEPWIQFPREAELARDSVVPFEMIDGRVYHRDMAFKLGTMEVRTHGSVGLDQTLDLVAEIRLPRLFPDRPLLAAMSDEVIQLPIVGTFQEPRIDAGRAAQSTLKAFLSALDRAGGGDGSTADLTATDILEQLSQAGIMGEDGLIGGGQMIERFRQEREAGEPLVGGGRLLRRLRGELPPGPPSDTDPLAEGGLEAVPPAAEGPAGPATPPRGRLFPRGGAQPGVPPAERPLLREGLRILEGVIQDAIENPPTNPGGPLPGVAPSGVSPSGTPTPAVPPPAPEPEEVGPAPPAPSAESGSIEL